MARILVVGERAGVAGRTLLERLVRRLRSLGQDAALYGQTDEGPARSVAECDGIVAVLDTAGAETAAVVAYAHAKGKPVLGLALPDATIPKFLADAASLHRGADEETWSEALPGFCDKVRPFAGRLVRDQVPKLVKEAGYDLTFRQLSADDKPRFLKQKIAAEAQELEKADLGREKEEVADVLEALEAFLVARGFDREDLRRVKDAKRKRRGAFEQCWVVEATVPAQAPNQTPGPADPAEASPVKATKPSTSPNPSAATGPVPEPALEPAGIDFEFPEEDVVPEENVDSVGPNKTVQANFFEV